jgi:hypothetical protein
VRDLFASRDLFRGLFRDLFASRDGSLRDLFGLQRSIWAAEIYLRDLFTVQRSIEIYLRDLFTVQRSILSQRSIGVQCAEIYLLCRDLFACRGLLSSRESRGLLSSRESRDLFAEIYLGV